MTLPLERLITRLTLFAMALLSIVLISSSSIASASVDHAGSCSPIDEIYKKTDLPIFEIRDPELFEVDQNGLVRYQSSITVSNSSETSGVLVVNYAEKANFDEPGVRTDIIKIGSGQTKKINAVFDYRPAISINTVIVIVITYS